MPRANDDFPRTWFGVPFPRNHWFTGREEALDKIATCLIPRLNPVESQDQRSRVFSLHGLPGIGKTHVAVEFGYRYRDSFTHIFWISSDSREKLEQGYANIAKSLGLASTIVVEDKDKIIGLARSWLSNVPKGNP